MAVFFNIFNQQTFLSTQGFLLGSSVRLLIG